MNKLTLFSTMFHTVFSKPHESVPSATNDTVRAGEAPSLKKRVVTNHKDASFATRCPSLPPKAPAYQKKARSNHTSTPPPKTANLAAHSNSTNGVKQRQAPPTETKKREPTHEQKPFRLPKERPIKAWLQEKGTRHPVLKTLLVLLAAIWVINELLSAILNLISTTKGMVKAAD